MKKQNHLIAIIIAISLVSCRKEGKQQSFESIADKISGKFNGDGKYLPGGIDLGNTVVCTLPPTDYKDLYQTGNASIEITKITDSTVKIVFVTGPFPSATYPEITIKEVGNRIEFRQGVFDSNSKTIIFEGTAPDYSYSYSRSCNAGLPYYASFLFPGPTGFPEYFNTSIKRYEFEGMKQ